MKKIGVVTGTRADYGILKPLIKRINYDSRLELCLIVTGTHLEDKYGNTVREIETDGFPVAYRIPMKMDSCGEKDVVRSMAIELAGFSEVFFHTKADCVVVLGDRFEALIAAVAATVYRIPIAHIHGGELTEGAIDDVFRHSITKMSSLHFPATKIYANRIIQMGEDPGKVFHVGALGVENIQNCRLYHRTELARIFGDIFLNQYVMVTYHPVTLEADTAERQLDHLLRVIEQHEEFGYIFTFANADPGGIRINKRISDFAATHKNMLALKSMGQTGYLSALKYCEMVVGNSSSGLLEAPSFGIPTINIGDRQKGRIRADSVIDCGYEMEHIADAFEKATSDFKYFCRNVINPYEGENTSGDILEIMVSELNKGINLKKQFYDFT